MKTYINIAAIGIGIILLMAFLATTPIGNISEFEILFYSALFFVSGITGMLFRLSPFLPILIFLIILTPSLLVLKKYKDKVSLYSTLFLFISILLFLSMAYASI